MLALDVVKDEESGGFVSLKWCRIVVGISCVGMRGGGIDGVFVCGRIGLWLWSW